MNSKESLILIVTCLITSLASLLTLIGLTTPKWLLKQGLGLWNCNGTCSSSTATLTILALLLLVAGTVLLILLLAHLFPRKLRLIPICLIIIGTLFLIGATSSYLRRFNIIGYSYELIVAAHSFAFLASVCLAYWYGQTMNEGKPLTNPTPTIFLSPTRAL